MLRVLVSVVLSLTSLGLFAGFVALAAGASTLEAGYGTGPGMALMMILQG